MPQTERSAWELGSSPPGLTGVSPGWRSTEGPQEAIHSPSPGWEVRGDRVWTRRRSGPRWGKVQELLPQGNRETAWQEGRQCGVLARVLRQPLEPPKASEWHEGVAESLPRPSEGHRRGRERTKVHEATWRSQVGCVNWWAETNRKQILAADATWARWRSSIRRPPAPSGSSHAHKWRPVYKEGKFWIHWGNVSLTRLRNQGKWGSRERQRCVINYALCCWGLNLWTVQS